MPSEIRREVVFVLLILVELLIITVKLSFHFRSDNFIGLFVCLMVFNAKFKQHFSCIVAVSFIGGGTRRTLRKQPTCHTSLTNFVVHLALIEILIRNNSGDRHCLHS